MRVLGVARVCATWVIGSYLLALTIAAPVYALWVWRWDARGMAVALMAGPVCAVLGTLLASRKLLAASTAVPVRQTPALAEALRQQGVLRPQVWVCPALAPGEALAVRALRRTHLVLPGSDRPVVTDGTLASVPAAVSQVRWGTAAVLPLYAAVCAWTRVWADLARFALQPLTDRRLDWYVRASLLPLTVVALLAAPVVLLGTLSGLVLTLLVGPGTARRTARVLGTADGRPLARVRHTFRYVPLTWRSSSAPFDAISTVEDRVPHPDAPREVGLLGLPRAVGAGHAAYSHLALLPAVLMIGLTTWFCATLPAERLVWPGEHAATGVVAQRDYGYPGTEYLAVIVDGHPVPVQVPPAAHPGQRLRLAASTAHGWTDWRDRDATSLARVVLPGLFALGLALVPIYVLPRRLVAGPMAEAASVEGHEQGRLPGRLARVRRTWPLWLGVLVVSSVAAELGHTVGGVVGRILDATVTGQLVGFWVGGLVVFAGLTFLMVRFVVLGSDPLGLVRSSDMATGHVDD